MSLHLKRYIDFLLKDSSNPDFLICLRDDELYFSDSLFKKYEEFVINASKKIPSTRSTKKEAITTYKFIIEKFNEFISSGDYDLEDLEILNELKVIFNYKLFLVNSDLNKKNISNSKKIRALFIEYIQNKYPKLLIIDNQYIYNENTDLKIIRNLSDYIVINNQIQKIISRDERNNIFYRGQSDYKFKVVPSIYRNSYIKNEHNLYRDILIRNPEEFVNTNSTFERLTIMQHYGLPTRLLDITKNPLVALYFACSSDNIEKSPAEVLIFKPESRDIKYYDSDTICILSNIVKSERNLSYNPKENFNKTLSGKRLLHLIKEDKPHFLNIIKKEDFNRVIVVKPINNNNRIKRQSGYFFIFGFNGIVTKNSEISCFLRINNKKLRILIPYQFIKNIKDELNNLNINNESLFPEIENGTNFLKETYNNT